MGGFGTRRRRLGQTAAGLGLLAGLLTAGCETIGEDFRDLTKGFMPPTPTEASVMALNQYDADERREGTLLLSNAIFGGDPPYVRMYREYAEFDPDPLVRAVGLRALAKHGSPDDAPLLARQLVHENVQVRWEAAKGLQRLHNPVVVPDLLAVLSDPDEHADVRVASAIALGQYREDRVFQGLLRALDARELAVNVAAERSLGILTGQTYGLDPQPWYAWYNSAGQERFSGGQEYLYPTYYRKETWLEKLAFWTTRVYEQPAPPAGLRPRSERRTYDDTEGGAPSGSGSSDG